MVDIFSFTDTIHCLAGSEKAIAYNVNAHAAIQLCLVHYFSHAVIMYIVFCIKGLQLHVGISITFI